jgi:hypothetical protein
MWWFFLFVGFFTAASQSFFYQTFNGLSLLGMMVMLLSAGFIVTKEIDR